VVEVVGSKGKHIPDRVAVRHGHEAGEVTLGGRRVGVERPRVRSADGHAEVRLRTYEHFADRDPLSRIPGRFDDAMRVAVVRRYRPCPAGVRALCLSLVMLGLIDSVALAPLALAAGVFAGAGNGVRAGLAVVAVAGVAAAALIVALPRLVASRRTLRFWLGRWLSPRTTSLRRASQAWVLVFHLLGRPGSCALPAPGCARDRLLVPTRAPLLCAGAAAAALPIGPAGATTQVGGGAAALLALGVGASQALSIAVSVAALGVLSGTAILLFTIAYRSGRSLTPTRAAA
jgi:hypothetical protein